MDDTATSQVIARGLERWQALLGRHFGPVSRPQRRVLATIASREVAGEAVRVGDIADQTGMTPAGATRMVDMLESLGFVRRFRLPESDQRQVYLALTDEGRAALQQADAVYLERVQASLLALTDQERIDLARLLMIVSRSNSAKYQ